MNIPQHAETLTAEDKKTLRQIASHAVFNGMLMTLLVVILLLIFIVTPYTSKLKREVESSAQQMAAMNAKLDLLFIFCNNNNTT